MSGGSRRPWRLGFLLLFLAACLAAFFWLSQSSLLAVEHIDVDGNTATPTDQILARAAPLLDGRSLLSFSFDGVDVALKQMPFIAGVDIDRDFPHTIHLHIHERQPVAWLKSANGYLLLSSDGYLLVAAPAPSENLPLLTTKDPCSDAVGQRASCGDVSTGINFLADVPENFDQEFTNVSVISGDISARTKTNVNIHFGSLDNYILKFEVLKQLIARTAVAGKAVSVDVSVPERPVTKADGG